MKELKQKKPKKQTKHDVLAGLKAGKKYTRPYSMEGGLIEGIEWLIPIGRGPVFSKMNRICEITSEDPPQKTEGVEDIDDELLDTVIQNGRWVQF